MQNLIYLQESNPYLFPILLLLTVLGLLFFVLYTIRKNRLIKLLNSDLLNVEYRDKELEEKVDTLSSELNINRETVMELTADKRGLETLIDEKTKFIETSNQEFSSLKSEFDELRNKLVEKEKEISELSTSLDKERISAQEKLSVLEEAKEKLSLEFQNLGNKIFEDKSKKFATQNKENIEGLLNPLREQIKDFDKKVSDTYEKETRERVSLLTQIEQLKNLNERISLDAINLTKALKGESKTQGTWGEVILEKVLEMSGLRKGAEYETQETFRNDEGKMLRPDVIVHLPDGKDVVIDAKVSLTAYERYSSSEDEIEKQNTLKDHLLSITNHINELNSKNYEELKEIKTLNYVLMFIPIESAFMLAIEKDANIFKNAFDKNIILVCPSTLLATLRTVQSLWQFDNQSKNAQIIADKAGRLYDQFIRFVDHLESIGTRLDQATRSYEDAMKALSTGKGNLVRRVSELEKLGIKNKKSIPKEFISDEADENDSNQDAPIKFPYKT